VTVSVHDTDSAAESSSSSWTSKSFTWATGDMFFIAAGNANGQGDAISTVTTTGSDLSFTQVGSDVSGYGCDISVYRGTVTGSSSGTITINLASTASGPNYHIAQLRASGGSIAFDGSDSDNFNDGTIELSHTTTETDAFYIAHITYRLRTFTPATGYTEEIFTDNGFGDSSTIWDDFASSGTHTAGGDFSSNTNHAGILIVV